CVDIGHKEVEPMTRHQASLRSLARRQLGRAAFVLIPLCGSVASCADDDAHVDTSRNGSALGACASLTIAGVTASGTDGNVPSNVLDNNLSTRWSSYGIGQTITLDLGTTKALCSAQIAWYRGNLRTNTFKISVSSDGSTFTDVFTGKSSGTTTGLEMY